MSFGRAYVPTSLDGVREGTAKRSSDISLSPGLNWPHGDVHPCVLASRRLVAWLTLPTWRRRKDASSKRWYPRWGDYSLLCWSYYECFVPTPTQWLCFMQFRFRYNTGVGLRLCEWFLHFLGIDFPRLIGWNSPRTFTVNIPGLEVLFLSVDGDWLHLTPPPPSECFVASMQSFRNYFLLPKKHTDDTTPCGQNAESFNIQPGGTYSYHCSRMNAE
jgi:hypothetical protein